MSMWVARCHYPILFVPGHASQLVYKKAREWRVYLSSFTCILHACVFVLALLHFLLSFVHFQYLIYPCIFQVAWGLCLSWRTWERFGLWSKGLNVSHVVF